MGKIDYGGTKANFVCLSKAMPTERNSLSGSTKVKRRQIQQVKQFTVIKESFIETRQKKSKQKVNKQKKIKTLQISPLWLIENINKWVLFVRSDKV